MPIIIDQEEKVKEICQKSYEEFIKYGIQNISLNQIITNIGISKGQFYHYFKTKEELIFQVISQKTFELSKLSEDEIKKAESLLECLKIIFKFYVSDDEYFVNMRKLMFETLHIYINSNNPQIKEFNENIYQWLDDKLIEVFQNHTNEFISINFIKSISSTADGMYFRSLADERFQLQAELLQYFEELSQLASGKK